MSDSPSLRGGAAGRLPTAFLAAGSSSFADFLADVAPHLLPSPTQGPSAAAGGSPALGTPLAAPHGTTVVALTFGGGVVVAGDRRSTMGNVIASRDLDKVFAADEYSVVGVAGTAGIAVEVVRLFQVELEHFEKIEGTPLSLEGKANRLAAMIRGNLGLAMHGMAVVPLFAGIDAPRVGVTPPASSQGRIFSYDVTGGCYEERDHHSIGSGSLFARGALKKLWRPGLDEDAAVRVALEALYDAADDDSATGGPDLGRRIWPTCFAVEGRGAHRWSDEALADVAAAIVADRMGNPGGAR